MPVKYMLIIRSLINIKKFKKPVVALGVFDGLHLGHLNILRSTVSKAGKINGTSVVVTFWPHPQKKESIYSLEHRLMLMRKIGIDACVVIRFDKGFSDISPRDFVKKLLVERLAAHTIYVGENFRFGKGAKGDAKLLKRFAKEYNFNLRLFKVIMKSGNVVSSTLIRRFILQGNLYQVAKLLGRPVSVLGTVIKGASLASKWGLPTANINPHHEVLPPSGIYAVEVVIGEKKYQGVCYIGAKPTFKTRGVGRAKHIEVYIFNFRRYIYGKYLEIRFVKKIREDKKFNNVGDLVEQIKKDVSSARRILSRH